MGCTIVFQPSNSDRFETQKAGTIMTEDEITLSRDSYDGFVSITTNETAFKLFNQAGDVARGMGHSNTDPIHIIVAALRDSNVYWKFAREVEPVTYAEATRAAKLHYDGPRVEAGTEPVITQFTPAMQQLAARLHREQHQWIGEQLASHNGVDTASWGVRDMLLAFSVESDSPAVKALALQGSTSSV